MDVRAITRGRARGLTAIERITTVAVAIVLLAAGIPGLRGCSCAKRSPLR